MKKILTIVIVCFLVLGGLGVVAIHNETHSQTEQVTIKDTWVKSEPLTIIQEESYIKVTYEKESSLLMVPGKPLLPRIVKSFELPFGATNINVQVTPSATYEQIIDKQIQPSPSPMPLSPIENYKAPLKKDTQLYQSTDPYPFGWYQFDVGVGVNDHFEHVTFVTVHLYPVRYIPAENTLIIAEQADITISYTRPETNPFPQTTDYDLAVIAPSIFSDALQPLIDHKNSYGVETILKTTEEIYNEYDGVDEAEQIKLFIKDALEQYNIKYVLLVGGLKSTIYAKPRDNANIGSTGWHVPVRYSNVKAGGDSGFPTDLYYADVYKEGGEFETWDSDGDGILAEWYIDEETGEASELPEDVIDYVPDVAVGRLASSDAREVSEVVNKIITYETTSYGSEWFKKMIVISGDGFLDQFDLNIKWDTSETPDGEYTINAQSFNPENEHGPIDTQTVNLDKTVASEITFNHDDHLNPALEEGYPAPPIAEIVSISEGNILGNTDVTYTPSGGEAYCNDLFWWANISYVDEVLTIRGKSYDPKPYGNVTNIHVWVENNQGDVVFSDWRNNTSTYYEGEWVTGEKAVNGRGGALYYMPEEFDTNILWTSNGKFTGPDDVISSYSEGCGFAFFSGHGSPGVWQNQKPGIPGNRGHATVQGLWVSHLRSFPPFISERPVWPMKELSNTNKCPVTVVGGCHNSLFTVSLIPSAMNYYSMMLGRDNQMWTGIEVVPQCWSWYLVQLPNTGAIATIGNAGLGWGWEGEFCTVGAGDGWISSEFFKQYGEHYGQEEYQTLGQVYQQTLTSYVNTFKDFTLPECWWYPDLGWDAIDAQAVEQWILLGDPSLKLGGYQ